VEPGRVGVREVKVDARMLLQEVAHRLGFVGGEIVEDDVNLLPGQAQSHDLLQEGDELAAGMPGGGFAVDAAGGGVQRGVQGKRAVAVVFEAVTFGPSGGERQNGVETDARLEWRSSRRRRTRRRAAADVDRGRGCGRPCSRTRGRRWPW